MCDNCEHCECTCPQCIEPDEEFEEYEGLSERERVVKWLNTLPADMAERMLKAYDHVTKKGETDKK